MKSLSKHRDRRRIVSGTTQKTRTPVLETLEGRRLLAADAAVTDLFLVDASTGQDIVRLDRNATLDYGLVKDKAVSIRAAVEGAVESVRFSIKGISGRVENDAPYSLTGDKNGAFRAWDVTDGKTYEIVATPYTGNNARGSAGDAVEVSVQFLNFQVEHPEIPTVPDESGNGDDNSQDPAPNGPTVALTLVNADSGADLFQLTDGITLNLNELPTNKLNVRADASDKVYSIRFDLDDANGFRTERSLPYALFGDFGTGYYGETVSAGQHTLTATIVNADGSTGNSVKINFNVVGQSTQPNPEPQPEPEPQPQPDPEPSLSLNAPSNVTVSSLDHSSLKISWKDNSDNEKGFVLQRSLDGQSFKTVVTLGANKTTYTHIGLDASTKYYYRVVAYASGETKASAVVSGTTAAAPVTNPNPDPNPEPNPQPNPDPGPWVPGSRPDATNTGPKGNLVKHSGGMTITKDGTVIENMEFTGDLQIKANNVTIRNVKATGLKLHEGYHHLLVEDAEFTDPDSSTLVVITGHNATLRRLHVHHGGGDGFKLNGNNTLLENSYIHHLGMSEGSHADGIQTRAVNGRFVDNVIVRGNNFDMGSKMVRGKVGRPQYNGYNSNAILFIEGKVGTYIMEGNWINGGNYSVKTGSAGSGTRFINNKFGREYNWGIRLANDGFKWTDTNWVGNVWADNGKPTH